MKIQPDLRLTVLQDDGGIRPAFLHSVSFHDFHELIDIENVSQ